MTGISREHAGSRPIRALRDCATARIEDCLACLAFPLAHCTRVRTTNGLERLNEEIKRRTRVVRIFPNADTCLRLMTALCVEQSEEWVSGRRYLEMGELHPIVTKEGQ